MAFKEALTRSLLLLLLLVLSGHSCSSVDALTVDDLYPFGNEYGDTIVSTFDEPITTVSLPYPVPVLGDNLRSWVYVSPDGVLQFRRDHMGGERRPVSDDLFSAFPANGDEFSMVAAFWTALYAGPDDPYSYGYPYLGDESCNGNPCSGLAYRVVDDVNLLANITSDIRGALPNEALANGFTPEAAFIATWVNVTEPNPWNRDPPILHHTFQAVIAFNRRTVFVGLLYLELTFGGPKVQAGINIGDGVHSFRLPSSFSSTATFDDYSNVGQAGKWWFGLDVSSNAIIGSFDYLDEPLAFPVCEQKSLGGGSGVDACGNQRVMDWDLDNDGMFDDATGITTAPIINTDTLRLTPGTHPISVRISSPSLCPGAASDPIVLNTTLTLIGSRPHIASSTGIITEPATGNLQPQVTESILIVAYHYGDIPCNDATTTLDCGAGSIAPISVMERFPGYSQSRGVCRYSTRGVKTITVNITQNGFSASGTKRITVVKYKQACSPDQYPYGGRALGQRGCTPTQWTLPAYSCNYPIGAGIRPSTPLWQAFANRNATDAALIRSFFGNRTMAQAVRITRNDIDSDHWADLFASEGAAALLNALALPYAQCPKTVKYKFKLALHIGVLSQEAIAIFNAFEANNKVSNGCTLPACA